MASTASSSSAASAIDDAAALPDPRRLFPPVATAGLETLHSMEDVSGLDAPPPPAPLQSPKKKKRPLLLFCSCT